MPWFENLTFKRKEKRRWLRNSAFNIFTVFLDVVNFVHSALLSLPVSKYLKKINVCSGAWGFYQGWYSFAHTRMAQSWHPFQLAEDHLQRIVLLLYNYLYFEYHHWLNIFTALWCWDFVRHVNYDSGLTCTTLLRESFLPTAFAENIHFWLNYKTPHPNHLPILATTDCI